MKREGTFCDFEVDVLDDKGNVQFVGHSSSRGNIRRTPCPEVAVGACLSCAKDVCGKNHGAANGVSVSIRYEVVGGGTVEIVTGQIVACHECLGSIKAKQQQLREFLIPGVLAQIAEGVRGTLAADALKK